MQQEKIKLLVVGGSKAGKTKLLEMYVFGQYVEEDEQARKKQGMEKLFKTVTLGRREYVLDIYDTCGLGVDSLPTFLFRGTQGIFVAVDLSQPFQPCTLEKTLEKVTEQSPTSIKMVVGTKKDAIQTDKAELITFCRERSLGYILTSAKNNYNIQKCFLAMLQEITKAWKQTMSIDKIESIQISIHSHEQANHRKCMC